MALKIVFAGTPEFASVALKALIDSPHQVIAVYTQPDRPAGRGRKLKPSPVKQLAEARSIPVHQPLSLKDNMAIETLAALDADVMIVAAYGLLLPQAILSIPHYGCLNIHASLLPRWRGAAPIQRAILAGDDTSGVTIMQMDAGLDTGDMLVRRETAISPEDSAASLHDRLADLGAQAILETLQQLEQDKLDPQPQNPDQATYASKVNKAEAQINWHQDAEVIARQIRAFNPWPVAFTCNNSKVLRIWSAKSGTSQGQPGRVVSIDKQYIEITCGHNSLLITSVQPAGGKQMDVASFLNGHSDWLEVGKTILSDCPAK